jgi:hypothetical protein
MELSKKHTLHPLQQREDILKQPPLVAVAMASPSPTGDEGHFRLKFSLANNGAVAAKEVARAVAAAAVDAEFNEDVLISKNAFPLNLTRMLESVKRMGKTHIINWTEDERSFVIHDVGLFRLEVLPKFFA